MKRIAFVIALAATSMSPLAAQTVEDLAKEYTQLPGVQQMMDDMLSPKSMIASFEAGLPPNIELTDDKRERIGQMMSESMKKLRPRMEEMMISGSTATFSVDEMQALIDFYSSEHGGSVMAKMQPFMQQVMGELGPELQKMQQEIVPDIIEIVQE